MGKDGREGAEDGFIFGQAEAVRGDPLDEDAGIGEAAANRLVEFPGVKHPTVGRFGMGGIGDDDGPFPAGGHDVVAAVFDDDAGFWVLQDRVVFAGKEFGGINDARLEINDREGFDLRQDRGGSGSNAAAKTNHQDIIGMGMKHGAEVAEHLETDLVGIENRHLGVGVDVNGLGAVDAVARDDGGSGAAFAKENDVGVAGQIEAGGEEDTLAEIGGDSEQIESNNGDKEGSHRDGVAGEQEQAHGPIEQRGEQQRFLNSNERNQDENGEEGAGDGSGSVDGVEQADAAPERSELASVETAQSREIHTHKGGGQQHRDESKTGDLERARWAEGKYPRARHEGCEDGNAEEYFDDSKGTREGLDAAGQKTVTEGAKADSKQVDTQDGGKHVGGTLEDGEGEVAEPDNFANQAGQAVDEGDRQQPFYGRDRLRRGAFGRFEGGLILDGSGIGDGNGGKTNQDANGDGAEVGET